MVHSLNLLNSEIVRSAYMGICFMILFSGFYTISNLEKLFLQSTQQENPSFTGDGYVSLAVLYSTFAVFMWMVPSVISLVGPKMTLIIGSLGYSLFIASFLAENAWLLYATSICCGMGASMIWTSQGNYMILTSSPLTLTRNLAIFNVIWQSSMFYGNIFAFMMFEGKDHLDKETRTSVLLALLAISVAGTVAFMLLPPPVDRQGNKIIEKHGGPLQALKKTWEIASTKYMLILFISFVYMGLQICFMSGVFGACVGFTKQLPNSEQLVPLVGLIVGAGEIISECVLIWLGKRIALWKWGQTVVMLCALAIEYAAFILVLLNFPNNSVFGVTEDSAIIPSSWWIAVVAALLIGLTDGIYMSMIPALVGAIFPNDSVYGCAMFTFVFKLFLQSTQQENPSFTGDGYVSLAVLYSTFAVFMWMVPSVISLVGPKMTLIIGSLGYSLFIASFLAENAWLLYATSICCGMGASMIWTSQGNYMILTSSPLTLTRNLAIFNVIWQSSMFYGNIFAFMMFEGKDHLDKETRKSVLLALLAISVAGTVAFMLLPPPVDRQGNKIIEKHGGPIQALKKTWEIASTKYMLILFISFVYMGLQICFMSGVFGACVGFTKQLPNSEQLVPLVGLIVGAGEIISECVLIWLGKRIALWKWGQTVVMLCALAIEYAAFILVLLNFPNNSVFGVTEDSAIIPSSWWIAVVAALLIGLTDGIYMSMIPALVGAIFPNDSVYGCAMFTFVFSLFSAVGFFSSNYVGLYWQLLVLTVTGTCGALCYIYVSLDIHRESEKEKQQTKM